MGRVELVGSYICHPSFDPHTGSAQLAKYHIPNPISRVELDSGGSICSIGDHTMSSRTHHHYLIRGRQHLGWAIGLWHTDDEYQRWLANDRPEITLYGDPTRRQGIWIPALNVKLEDNVRINNSDITDEGIVHDNYTDLVTPFDSENNEILVGDRLYIAVKNDVRRATVTRIAARPQYVSSVGYTRKLTVADDKGQKLTINSGRSTIRDPHQ